MNLNYYPCKIKFLSSSSSSSSSSFVGEDSQGQKTMKEKVKKRLRYAGFVAKS